MGQSDFKIAFALMKVEIFTWILSFTFVAFGGQKTGTQFGTPGWF